MWKLLTSAVFLAVVYIASAVADEFDTNEIEPTENVNSAANRGRLIKDLFKSYDKRNYPSNNTLNMGLALRKFDVDEVNGNALVDAWLRLSWTDKRFTWDPTEYGGETVIRIEPKHVWTPDLNLYNTASCKEANECRDTNTLIYSNGMVLWVPPCQYKVYCNLTIDVEPYAEQKCSLKFGSWTYDGFLLDLQFYNKTAKADLADFWDATDYEITGNTAVRVNKKYDCCAEPYPYISFDFAFQRRKSTVSRSRSCQA